MRNGVQVKPTNPRSDRAGSFDAGAPEAALVLISIYLLFQDRRFAAGLSLMAQFCAVFLVPLLVHATQFVTNVRFWDLSDRWDELAGWQRGTCSRSQGRPAVPPMSSRILPWT
jgi:hypothetical protein